MSISSLKSWQINTGGIVSLALLTLVAYALVVRPTFALRHAAAAQMQQMEQATAHERQLERELKVVREKAQHAEKELEYSQGNLLQPIRDLNRRLAEVEAAASQAGVQINTVQPASPRNLGKYRSIRISMSGHGGFPQIVKFLHVLHESIQHVAVVSFELSGTGTSGGGAVPIAFMMELDWYAAPRAPVAVSALDHQK